MAERRSAVMIVADAWWEEPGGSLKQGKVRIVNKSVSGACVRMEKRIEVGTKLRIEARWDEFSGVAKYCRSEGSGFLVGIQRKIAADFIPKQTAGRVAAKDDERRENLTGDRGTVRGVAGAPPSDQRLPSDRLANEERVETARIAEIVVSAPRNEVVAERAGGLAVEVLAPKVSYKRSPRRRWHGSQHQGVPSQAWWEARATLHLKQKEAQRDAQEEAQKEGIDSYGDQLDGPRETERGGRERKRQRERRRRGRAEQARRREQRRDWGAERGRGSGNGGAATKGAHGCSHRARCNLSKRVAAAGGDL